MNMMTSVFSMFRLKETVDWVGARGGRGIRNAANALLTYANRTVPYEDGDLKDSGHVSVQGEAATVSYDTPYAVRLHENPQYNFQGSGRGKWLQLSVEEFGDGALREIETGFR